MERWMKGIPVVVCSVMMVCGAGLDGATRAQPAPTQPAPAQQAPAQQAPPPPTAQLPPKPADRGAKQQVLRKPKLKVEHSEIELDSVLQDEPAHRSKVCTIEKTPATISCVFAVSHVVGGSCTCKVGDQLREGRFLKR